MRVVSTFHSPSTVVSSVRCRLSGLELDHLVIAKTNRIEVYALTPEGLVFRTSIEIWGHVLDIKAVKNRASKNWSIAAVTDCPDPRIFLLEYILRSPNEPPTLSITDSLSLVVRGLRTAEYLYQLTVSPDNDIVLAAPYVGKMRMTRVDNNKLEDLPDFNVRELNILSLAFLPPVEAQLKTVAFLYLDHKGKMKLCGHDMEAGSQDLSTETSRRLPEIEITDSGSNRLVALPSTSERKAGVLVLGGQTCYFYRVRARISLDKGKLPETSPRKEKTKADVHSVSISWPYSSIVAHCFIDDDGSRILLSDKYGKLLLLTVSPPKSSMYPVNLNLELLGETSPASTLSYLNIGFVYLGAHRGDHKILQLLPEKQSNGSHFREIESFHNIAPILDACIVEKDGIKEIVTASGGGNSGSLRIIRNGADFRQLAHIQDVPSIRGMWALKLNSNSTYERFLVLSTITDTRIISFENDRLEQIEHLGLKREVQTLACSNFRPSDTDGSINSSIVVQVTRSSVIAIDIDSGNQLTEWVGPAAIQVASISETQVGVATRGGRVFILTMSSSQGKEVFLVAGSKRFGSEQEPHEISCISCIPHLPDKPNSRVVVVGFWGLNTVEIFVAPNFMQVGASLSMPHVPRSLLLSSFGGDKEQLHLLVGLGDGTMRIAFLDPSAAASEIRTVNLGNRPVILSHCRTKEGWGVFACGNMATILYYENGHVRHSPLSLKGVISSCPLDSEMFPSSLVFSNSSGLVIGAVRDVQKLHIRTVPLGLDCPHRVSHHPELGLLGVGSVRTEPSNVGELETVTSSFSTYDDVTFQRINTFSCDESEEIYSSTSLSLTWKNTIKTVFAVGTVYMNPEEREPSRGRLLIFDAVANSRDLSTSSEPRSMWCLAAHRVTGCIYSIAESQGRVIAAVNTTVIAFSLEAATDESGSTDTSLKKLSEINHSYLVTSLATRDDFIFIADTLNSVSLIKFDGNKLEVLAKSYTSLWPISIEVLNSRTILGANAETNLFTYSVQSAEQRYNLELEGMYHLGEMVNKFLPGALASVSSSDKYQAQPQQLFFTTVGRIGVVSEFGEEVSLALTELQRNLAELIKGPGGINHAEWRRPMTVRGPTDTQPQAVGFLDGDFLELYLSRSTEELDKIRRGRNDAETLRLPHHDIIQVLEKLQVIH